MKRVLAVVAIAAVLMAFCLFDSSAKGDGALATFATSLAGRTTNQVHNARLASMKLDGAQIAPGETFSFIRRVGTWSRDQGYRRAPVSYNGTLIDSWGGGVCQTSTTLYNAAMLAGMIPVERNPHRFCPDYVPPGRDAAVAFSDIDLRFKNPLPYPVGIRAKVEGEKIVISITGAKPLPVKPEIVSQVQQMSEPRTIYVGFDAGASKWRNPGKKGWEVATYRLMGGTKELLSVDSYPAMNRIVEVH
jgi:vancomycin resistance protein YoaR